MLDFPADELRTYEDPDRALVFTGDTANELRQTFVEIAATRKRKLQEKLQHLTRKRDARPHTVTAVRCQLDIAQANVEYDLEPLSKRNSRYMKPAELTQRAALESRRRQLEIQQRVLTEGERRAPRESSDDPRAVFTGVQGYINELESDAAEGRTMAWPGGGYPITKSLSSSELVQLGTIPETITAAEAILPMLAEAIPPEQS